MGRLYHSASSDALGQRCEYAWWLTYVRGIRDPRVEWADIAHYVASPRKDENGVYWWVDPHGRTAPVTGRQRSTALGVAMHARLESWYTPDEPVDWHDIPGQIAQSGLHFLPHPSLCEHVRTEAPIGDAAIVGDVDAHAPPVGLRVAGVLWAGFRDLVVKAPAELVRLKIQDVAGGHVLVDYKSSADIARYALTPAELEIDFAANLYALATMTEIHVDRLPAHWVYFESKRRRHAESRDAVITRDTATEIVLAGSERARRLDSFKTDLDPVKNTLACNDYGGCPHHHSVGGLCNAQQSFGTLIQARVKKTGNKMALPPGIAASLPSTPANGAPPATSFGQNAAPPPAPEAPVAAAPPPPPAAAEKPARAGKKAAAASAVSGDEDSLSMQGNFGQITITGHAKDVIAAYKILNGQS